MFKRILLILGITALFFNNAVASHIMGGEITWDCMGGGQYMFTLKLYRDCNGAPVSPTATLNVYNHPTVFTIPVALVSQKDISPVCNAAGPAITCAGATGAMSGAVQENVYQSGLISLPGTPPAVGWAFTFEGCCRNAMVNIASGINYTFRAVMHAYNGQNDSPCFDSSPRFSESPNTIICLGYPFTYNDNAYDPDKDSLSYSFAPPLDTVGAAGYNPPISPTQLVFAAGYSYTSPLPSTLQDPSNVPATIDSHTGVISFTSFTSGKFVTVIKVEAWKCGQLVAEIYREMEVVLLPCAPNNPPTVTYTAFADTVVAGAIVNFTLNGNDPGVLADGVTPQTVSILASGNQFGTGFTSTVAGCSNPPCATLSPAPPTSAPTNIATTFNWQTSCNHIANNASCNAHANTYTFVFTVKDDFCPAPAENISTVSITVLAHPVDLSPQPRCVSVLPNGDVTLTWSVPVDTGGIFNAYMIYTANSAGGPFTLLDSIFTLSQNTYTHVGANGNAAPVYYYIQTRSNCGGQILSPPLDTVNSIHLNVINPGNGTAVLNWNAIASPNLVSSTGVYNIYQEYPTGVWTLTGTTTGLNYIDTIFICNAVINYRVEIADTSGCISVSSIDGGTFQNIIVPAIPVIDTLSVDDNNNALLNWNANSSPDCEAYVVYEFIGGVWVAIDTVYGINNTNYNYLLSNADANSEQYRLAAFDTCGNISPLGTPMATMHLTATADICARSAILNWNAYPTIGTGLAGYDVYQSTVGMAGPWTLIGTVPAGTLTFTASGLAPNTTYYFKITAFDAGHIKTSSSNRFSFYSASPIPPLFSYLRKVSVVEPNRVDVTCHIDVAASTLKYKVMRSYDNVPANFHLVGTVPASATSPVLFSDYNVIVDKYSYYYKIINVDSCGYDGIETNIGRTILVNAISNSDFTNTITWNDYETWLGNVMSYNIYRGIDGAMDPTPIANVPFGGTNSYTDDISMLLNGEGVFNYYVEALEGMGNMYGFSDNSTSNVAEAYQDPHVFIPNAFKPGSYSNPIFIPVTTYVDFKEYGFEIFNRWGLQVFGTTDVDKGWDGMHGGTKCEEGAYVYFVRFKTSKGEYLEYKGSVTLIR